MDSVIQPLNNRGQFFRCNTTRKLTGVSGVCSLTVAWNITADTNKDLRKNKENKRKHKQLTNGWLLTEKHCCGNICMVTMVLLFILILTQTCSGRRNCFRRAKNVWEIISSAINAFLVYPPRKRNVDYRLAHFQCSTNENNEPITAKRNLNDEPIRTRSENL